MTNPIVDSIDCAGRSICECLAGIGEAVLSAVNPSAPGLDELTPAERERIRQSLWRIRSDLDALPAGFFEDLSRLLDEAFGGPDAFVRLVRAWAELVDALILQAEQEFGSSPGRGALKKQQVKGAMLYLVRRANVDIPRIPSFLEPLIWDYLLDPLVDVLVRFSNRTGTWGAVPSAPSFRPRVILTAQRATGLLEAFARWLGRLAWALVSALSPTSARLKKAVDAFVDANPDPVRSVFLVVAWATKNTASIVALADLFAVVIPEAQLITNADEAHRKAYARELVLAFLQQEVGLPDRDSLRFRLLVTLVDLGVELFSGILQRRRVSLAPPTALPAAVRAEGTVHK